MSKAKTETGFTLIEVLIAVAVLAIGLLAVMRVTGVAIKNSEYLKQKTLAHWVAMDVMASAEVGLTMIPSPGGNQSGQVKILDKTYPWKMTANNVPNLPIIQVELQVFTSDNQRSLDSVYGYFPTPKVKA